MSLRQIQLNISYIMIQFIIIGIIAGWLGGKLMRGEGYGLLGNLILGVLGAFLGKWVLGFIGYSFIGKIIAATLGAMLLLFLNSLIQGNKSSKSE